MLKDAIATFPTKAAFCRAIGMSQQFLCQIENGERPLPARFAIAIEIATTGRFAARDLCPEILGQLPAPTQDPATQSAQEQKAA